MHANVYKCSCVNHGKRNYQSVRLFIILLQIFELDFFSHQDTDDMIDHQ